MKSKKIRIRELEQELEHIQLAAIRLADELISIIRPYSSGDPVAVSIAIRRVAESHSDMCRHGKAVH